MKHTLSNHSWNTYVSDCSQKTEMVFIYWNNSKWQHNNIWKQHEGFPSSPSKERFEHMQIKLQNLPWRKYETTREFTDRLAAASEMVWMKLVSIFKNLISADREGNWKGHLQAIQDTIPVFCQFESVNYQGCSSLYLLLNPFEWVYGTIFQRNKIAFSKHWKCQ